MQKLFFLLLISIWNLSAQADCLPTPQFRSYLDKHDLFSSKNPKALLDQFASDSKLSSECVLKMVEKVIPELALEWDKKAQAKHCFDTPPGVECPQDMRDEIYGNIKLLDQWSLWIGNNKTAPHASLCDQISVASPALGDLTQDTATILDVLNKVERLESKLKQPEKCEESSVVKADDSPNLQHFKSLLIKGETAPLEDFLQVWYPTDKKLEQDPFFFNCQSKPWKALSKTVVSEGHKYLAEECKPEFLYSWGPKEKLETMKKAMPDNTSWNGSPNPHGEDAKKQSLFLALTPASTYGYGDISIKIKVKRGTPFPTAYSHVQMQGHDKEDDGVRVRLDDFQDFNLNESAYIESWSYGTPQIYDELVRDLLNAKEKKRAQRYQTPSGETNDFSQKGLNVFFDQDADEFDFSEKALKQKMLALIKMILNNEGRVHFQSGTCRNQENHHKAKKPTYFNY